MQPNAASYSINAFDTSKQQKHISSALHAIQKIQHVQ